MKYEVKNNQTKYLTYTIPPPKKKWYISGILIIYFRPHFFLLFEILCLFFLFFFAKWRAGKFFDNDFFFLQGAHKRSFYFLNVMTQLQSFKFCKNCLYNAVLLFYMQLMFQIVFNTIRQYFFLQTKNFRVTLHHAMVPPWQGASCNCGNLAKCKVALSGCTILHCYVVVRIAASVIRNHGPKLQKMFTEY